MFLSEFLPAVGDVWEKVERRLKYHPSISVHAKAAVLVVEPITLTASASVPAGQLHTERVLSPQISSSLDHEGYLHVGRVLEGVYM